MLNHNERLEGIAAQATELMVRQFPGRIRKVILFGSVAKRTAREDSDVDLCVVVPTWRNLVDGVFLHEVADVLRNNNIKVGPDAGQVHLSCFEAGLFREEIPDFCGNLYEIIEGIKRGRVLYG